MDLKHRFEQNKKGITKEAAQILFNRVNVQHRMLNEKKDTQGTFLRNLLILGP
jgi:hypothetical protein